VFGNSGFTVELIDENTVRKAAHGSGSERLRRQITKQKSFYFDSQQGRIRVPKVRKVNDTSESFSAEIEFIAAKDFVQFLIDANRENLDDFANLVVDFIHGNVARSKWQDVSSQVVEKSKELANRGVAHKYIEAVLALCSGPVVVPVGPCHGDLTLSNILFKGKNLYMIDFLDSFIESPIQDIVKLRQDMCFNWSLEFYAAEFDRTKVQIILRYLDNIIETIFAPFVWYHNHYVLFQAMNLMRILPYCKNAKTTAFVSGHLDQLLILSSARPTSLTEKMVPVLPSLT
jgi:thiamine kinase-like enzyme